MARASRKSVDVLIAGAGPTGLALALWLAKSGGVRVRIVDKAPEAGTTSRALAVQARTLEFYRQLGIADDVVARGLEMEGVNFWVRGEKATRLAIGEIGKGKSPFPYVLIFPQDQHEALLTEHLEAAGVEVERPVELLGYEETEGGVLARLKRANGREETCEARYICGCDGAHSVMRAELKTGFPGGAYVQLFYVADVEASGPVMDKELHIAVDDSDFLGVFPLKGDGAARLVGAMRRETGSGETPLAWEDVSGEVLRRLNIQVEKVNWFSTYHVHHRVAGSFRRGRAFLLGDAAHIHSPAGGQGMNTGIGDAFNLAWKLAAVVRGKADAKLLDTYQPERIAFARKLVSTTDQIFTFATRPGLVAREMRTEVAPRLLPALAGTDLVRRFAFRTISQTAIEYHRSALSRGGAGHVVGGDRLPWAGEGSVPGGGDNFTPLASLDWQVHVYGEASQAVQEVCQAFGVALREFPWSDAFWRAGLMHDAVYLIRPDGHVALAEPNARAHALERYLETWGIGPAR
jgi:2-polyprenyl-6-methoxyphenol hydroxylase-like FAD-dependent oxidoreductase